MNKKRFVLFALLLTLILVGIPVVSAQDSSGVQTYTLGVAQPFTGSLGTYGTDFGKGIQLAVDQMNQQLSDAGVKIKFVVASADTTGTPDGAAKAVQTIVQTTGAQVIVGPLTTSEVLGAKQFADSNNIVLVAPASTGVDAAIPNDSIFRVFDPPDNFAAKAFVQIAVARGYANVVILHVDDPFGNGIVSAFTPDFQAAGGKQVEDVKYAPNPTDLSSEATALSSDVASLSASGKTAILCACYLADAEKLLPAAELDPTLSSTDWMGVENLASPDILKDSGAADFLRKANFISVSASDSSTPLSQEFIDAFKAKYGTDPGPFTNYAYDAANIAMLSMVVAGNDGKAVKQILPYIADHYIGTTVQAYLDANGDQAVANYGIKEVDPSNPDFVVVGTYDGSTDKVTMNAGS
ncbi:MAG TPA: penicillin-binding protein activator [Phototrophicaceae bacterium]|nr:penicillin-binding protein activator [Phototrophicaceae bacterium]